MKPKLVNILIVLVCAIAIGGCETDPKAEQVRKPYAYDNQYYANLREYKKSDHQIFYGWYAAYGNKEGVQASYKQSASWGEHIAGLPDSLDFCSLWMGIPSLKQNDSLTSYNPIAYNEMRQAMDIRGIKFVAPVIVAMSGKSWLTLDTAGIRKYAVYLTSVVLDNDLDGLDLDYEPGSSEFLYNKSNFDTLVVRCGQFVGPRSSNPDKYLIVDYYNYVPPQGVEPYINFLVNQAYTQGTTSTSATFLQSRYTSAPWCPAKKFIVTENFGDWWATGGSPYTEANGNTLTTNGTQMYSLEGMARWNPTQGQKGGFGAFYFDRDYNNSPPYINVRRCIQIINPAVH